jgi:hypothetical protein
VAFSLRPQAIAGFTNRAPPSAVGRNVNDFPRPMPACDEQTEFKQQPNIELNFEKLRYYRELNEDRSRARHEDVLNEALRKKGYPALYPATRRRRRS